MPEMAHAGEHHGEPGLVGRFDHLGVAHRDPPGWITAVAPASAIACNPSGKGKKASDAATDPSVSRVLRPAAFAACSPFHAAMRAEFDS